MPYLHEFLLLASVHLLAVIIPGPDFFIVVQQSISWGRKIGVATALGIGFGISIHVLYTLLGFALLIQKNELIFNITKVISSLYLIYLGFGLIKNNLTQKITPQKTIINSKIASNIKQVYPADNLAPQSIMSAFFKGFMVNVTNPKAIIFFLGIFTTIVSQSTPVNIQLVYGIWMCLINAIWFIIVTYLFTVTKIRALFLKQKKWIEMMMGIILVGFAVNLVAIFK